jgi:hypothetical protein
MSFIHKALLLCLGSLWVHSITKPGVIVIEIHKSFSNKLRPSHECIPGLFTLPLGFGYRTHIGDPCDSFRENGPFMISGNLIFLDRTNLLSSSEELKRFVRFNVFLA